MTLGFVQRKVNHRLKEGGGKGGCRSRFKAGGEQFQNSRVLERQFHVSLPPSPKSYSCKTGGLEGRISMLFRLPHSPLFHLFSRTLLIISQILAALVRMITFGNFRVFFLSTKLSLKFLKYVRKCTCHIALFLSFF